MKGSPPPADRSGTRQAAFDILQRIESAGAYATRLLAQAEPALRDPRDAALLHEIVLGVLRNRAVLDHVIERVASRPLPEIDPKLLLALRIGTYGVLFLDRVPAFAAVSTTVDLARSNGPASAVGFANAVMRRVAAQGAALVPAAPDPGDVAGLALCYSHPAWWVERVVAREGWEAARRLLEANNRHAAAVLRPDRRRTTTLELAARLRAEGIAVEACRFVPEALRIRDGRFARSAPFREGLCWVQDEASQLVPLLFGRSLRPRIADLCAAPGTKTLQLAEGCPAGGFIVATDRRPARLRKLVENLSRFAVRSVGLVAADMASAPVLAGAFDHVLVDAPCSGTGTLRRHPELRWRLLPDDLAALASRQQMLLETAAALVAPGGTIVYSVCSLEPEEGPERVATFLAGHPDFGRGDPAAGLSEAARELLDRDQALRTAPDRGELDGFYAALLSRG